MRRILKLLFVLVCAGSILSACSVWAAPRTVTISEVTVMDGAVVIGWKKVSRVDGYYVYRKEHDSNKEEKIADIKNANINYYHDTTGVPGTRYRYSVAAYDIRRRKKRSVGRRNYTSSYLFLPGTPVVKSITDCGEGKELIRWHPVEQISGYQILSRPAGSTGDWKYIGKAAAGEDDTVVISQGNCEYAVRAYVLKNGKKIFNRCYEGMCNQERSGTGESILFIGDSIVWGSVGSHTRTKMNFVNRVGELTGASVTNAGVPGACMAQRKSGDSSIVSRISRSVVNPGGYSVVVIAAGTNDYAKGIRLGSCGNSSFSNFHGAIYNTIRTIRKQNRSAKIVVISPIYRIRMGENWNFTGFRKKNKVGLTLMDYTLALKKAADRYGLLFYNSSGAKIINEKNAREMLRDGLHPSEAGYLAIGNSVADFLDRKIFRRR